MREVRPRKKKWTQTQRKFMKWAKNVYLSMKLNKKLWYVFTDTVLQLSCGRALTGMDFLCNFESYLFSLIFDI